jgi:hypothetical protein
MSTIMDFDFNHEERVIHVLGDVRGDPHKQGMIIARLDTGGVHYYLVQWGMGEPSWHLSAELKAAET